MCECKDKSKNKTAGAEPTSAREIHLRLFDNGQAELAKRLRMLCCCQATSCRFPCERLVKAPGKDPIFCVDIDTGAKIHLHSAMADPAFTCPRGVF